MSSYPALTDEQRNALRELVESTTEYINSLDEDTTDLNVYVVGGAIRDVLLGCDPNDTDFLVVNTTETVLVTRGFRDIEASSFGVLHDENREEWALARTEEKQDQSRTGNPSDAFGYKSISTNAEYVTLGEDLYRRDFTMNAAAMEITSCDIDMDALAEHSPDDVFMSDIITKIETEYGERRLIDPHGARSAVKHGEITHVSEKFSEDPLRVLRGARYYARYETGVDGTPFTVNDNTMQLMRQVAPELNLMSKDRIGEEIVKAMKQATSPSRFWELLAECGALAVIAPTLDRSRIVKPGADKYHREHSTFDHTMAVVERMSDLCNEQGITGMARVRRLMMAIGHDLGKVRIADKKGGLWSDDPPTRFGAHDEKGVECVEQFCKQTGLEPHIKCAMMDGAEQHMNFHSLPEWSLLELLNYVDDYTVPRDAKKPFQATINELLDLAHADHEGRAQSPELNADESTYEETFEATWLPDNSDAVRPVFDKEAFERPIQHAEKALQSNDGYSVMREELVANTDADDVDIEEESLASQLAKHDACRSPGEWIGDAIQQRRLERLIRREMYLGW